MNESKVDWESVRRDYESGILTLAQMAAKYTISKQRIHQIARKENWTKALSEKINKRTKQIVEKAALTAAQQKVKDVADDLVVAANAHMQAEIILAHRGSIGRGRRIVESLFDKLSIGVEHDDLLEILCDTVSRDMQDDPVGRAMRMSALQDVLALPKMASVILNLSTALKTLINAEREAFGIEVVAVKEATYEEGLRRLRESVEPDE